jgi:anti-sigma B factor antagonist
MSFQIQIKNVGAVTMLVCSGPITLGEATGRFRECVRSLLRDGARKILLDLGQVTYLDSSGIGELVSAYTSAVGAGAQIRLVHLPEKVYSLLQITKLVTVFEIFEDEPDAIRSFL